MDDELMKRVRQHAMEITFDRDECIRRLNEHRDTVIAECEKQCAMEASALALKECGLEKAVDKLTFEAFNVRSQWQRVIKERARVYVAAPDGKWFFMGGQSGAGKSHLCTAIYGGLVRRGRYCRYMSWKDDVPRLRAAQNTPEYVQLIDQFKKSDVLYIDDLFKTKDSGDMLPPTDADVRLAFEILNYRANNPCPTILSTQFELGQLVDIDEALGGRIKQMSGEFITNIARDRSKNYRLI